MNIRLKDILILAAVLSVVLSVNYNMRFVCAASAMIEFTASETTVNSGDTFTIVMTVNADDAVKSVDAFVTYDASKMSFVNGGKYVSGDSGLLHVVAADLAGDKNSVKFSLQFKASGKGSAAVGISDTATVNDTSGGKMSTSSNRVSVSIKDGQESAVSTPQTYEQPQTLSSDNKLNRLLVSNGKLEPAFDKDVTKYKLTVDNRTENLYFSHETSDSKASVAFSGNEGLKEGTGNKVRVVVTAPDGDVRTYSIKVYRETAEETKKREMTEKSLSGDIGFEVVEKDGEVYIKNDYEFKVVDVENGELIPSGYVKTSVRLYGVNVTAYTMANDLENDFLLMYCMNSNGDKEFYQYDRQEKSLQRYTGSLVDRVNSSNMPESAEDMTARQYEDNLNQLAIVIAVLAALCLLLVLSIISMAIRNIKSKSARTEDELDF